VGGRPRPRALTARSGSACGAKRTAPTTKMSASAGPRACCLDREAGGFPHRGEAPTGRSAARRPPVLFLFFEPLALDRQAVQPRAHSARHRHAPVARGSRDAAPLPPHACGSGGTATFLMALDVRPTVYQAPLHRRGPRSTDGLAGSSLPTRIFGTVLP